MHHNSLSQHLLTVSVWGSSLAALSAICQRQLLTAYAVYGCFFAATFPLCVASAMLIKEVSCFFATSAPQAVRQIFLKPRFCLSPEPKRTRMSGRQGMPLACFPLMCQTVFTPRKNLIHDLLSFATGAGQKYKNRSRDTHVTRFCAKELPALQV